MTEATLTYNYIDSNTPEEKINYSYSKYGGEQFLLSYFDSRHKVLPANFKVEVLVLNLNSTVQTEVLFNSWIKILQNQEEFNKVALNLLVKRFEVTKKLFEKYDADFRTLNKLAYSNIRLYVLFSFVLSLAFKKYKSLQYLNALLKVNDIIISNVTKLDDATKQIMYVSLLNENTFINELRDNLKP